MSHLDSVAQVNQWRTKSLIEKSILALGMVVLVLALSPFPTAVMVFIVMVTATLWGAKVPVRLWLTGIAAPLGFLAAGIVPVAFDSPALALGIAMRSIASVSCLVFLAMTTPATDVVRGLRRIGLPSEVSDIALLVYRLLFLFADTASAMNSAQAARLGTVGARRRLNSLGLLLANLLPRAFARAHRMEVGLMARGWHGEMRVLSPSYPVSWPGLVAVLVVEFGVAVIGVVGS